MSASGTMQQASFNYNLGCADSAKREPYSADIFGYPNMNSDSAGELFPSLVPKNRRNFNKRKRREQGEPMHKLSTNSTLLEEEIPKCRGGRPKKSITEILEPKKRIILVKEVDPNKPKRGMLLLLVSSTFPLLYLPVAPFFSR
jgi:hypothetical protein